MDTSPHTGSIEADDDARPELRAVALFEGFKGVLSLVAASALTITGPAHLQQWTLALLSQLRGGHSLASPTWLQAAINPASVRLAVLGITAYGLLRLLEAWGLWRARAWASWLGCVSATVYLPFELHALIRHPGWIALSVLAVNLAVVAVLGRDLWQRRH